MGWKHVWTCKEKKTEQIHRRVLVYFTDVPGHLFHQPHGGGSGSAYSRGVLSFKPFFAKLFLILNKIAVWVSAFTHFVQGPPIGTFLSADKNYYVVLAAESEKLGLAVGDLPANAVVRAEIFGRKRSFGFLDPLFDNGLYFIIAFGAFCGLAE